MAANTNPIFSSTPNAGALGVKLTSGTNNYDGTSGTTLLYTAGANGSFVQKITIKALGSNVATVIRLFLNNGSTVGTAANNAFFVEFTLPLSTAIANAQTQAYEFVLNKTIPANFLIYGLLATTVAAGYAVSIDGGDF